MLTIRERFTGLDHHKTEIARIFTQQNEAIFESDYQELPRGGPVA